MQQPPPARRRSRRRRDLIAAGLILAGMGAIVAVSFTAHPLLGVTCVGVVLMLSGFMLGMTRQG